MRIEEKFLPIGTVCKLVDESVAMINGYQGEYDGVQYDYIGVDYPNGYRGEESLRLFNHEDINVVLHVGFISTDGIEYNNNLNTEDIEDNGSNYIEVEIQDENEEEPVEYVDEVLEGDYTEPVEMVEEVTEVTPEEYIEEIPSKQQNKFVIPLDIDENVEEPVEYMEEVPVGDYTEPVEMVEEVGEENPIETETYEMPIMAGSETEEVYEEQPEENVEEEYTEPIEMMEEEVVEETPEVHYDLPTIDEVQ